MRLTDRQICILSAVICTALLCKHLLVPLNPDNDTYHAMAWQLFAYGKLPYLGSWDQNFPGIVYIHWLAISVFDNTALGFRILDALFHLANALLLLSLTRRRLDIRVAAVAAILYILYYTHDSFWLAGQRDGFAVTFLLLALRSHFKRHTPYLIGLFLGAATIIRPTFAIFGFAILFLENSTTKEKLAIASKMMLGAAIVWIIQFIPYALIENGLREYYLATLRFTADLYGGYALPWSNLLLWNRAQKIYFTILFVGAVVLLLKRKSLLPEQPHLRRFLLMMFGASILPVFVMRKFSIYHWDPLFTLLAPICAYLLVVIADLFKSYKVVGLLLLLAIVGFRLFPRHVVRDFFSPAAAGSRLEYVYDRIDHDTLYGEAAERDLATYIAFNSSPTDAIEIASIWPGAAWMAERRRASRFTTWYALAMSRDGKQTDYQRAWQAEYVDSIRSAQPKFVVVARGPNSFLLKPESEPSQLFFRLPGMSELMHAEYAFDTTMRGYDIYQRRATP